MNKIKILDCTLRDGGYINNWNFGEKVINEIIHNLEDAKIDIIECGFIRDVSYDVHSSVYPDMESLAKKITPKKDNVLYAVMVEQHNHVTESIPLYDGSGADIIRITFRRSEWEETKESVIDLIHKGYKVCVQPVGTVSYDDESLLKLVRDVNQIKPYAFYLVDTLGMMYRHEMRRFFYLVDNNLSEEIHLGFHSHNNLQMSFANAQEMIRLSRQRKLIIDTSCYGMGRGVGNLSTELLADYINNNIDQRYALTPVLNIVDKYLMPIYAEQRWGYDLPYFLSAIAKCHPNYAAYLIKKETIGIEMVEKILSLIPKEDRAEYNAELIEKLYFNMQNCEIDDRNSFTALKKLLDDRSVLILAPGKSVEAHQERIKEVANGCYVISANFRTDLFKTDAVFISNHKRANIVNQGQTDFVLATSNLKEIFKDALLFDYTSLLGEGDASDNAGAMLIRILKRVGVKKIYLAGFDGFDVDASMNYVEDKYKKSLDYSAAKKKNEDISKQLMLALNEVDYEVLTPTKYTISGI